MGKPLFAALNSFPANPDPSSCDFSAPTLLHSGQRSAATPPSFSFVGIEKFIPNLGSVLSVKEFTNGFPTIITYIELFHSSGLDFAGLGQGNLGNDRPDQLVDQRGRQHDGIDLSAELRELRADQRRHTNGNTGLRQKGQA